MASGHRKRKAAAVAANLLNPAGLTNYLSADLGVAASQSKLASTALYASGGVSPVFTGGSTTLLSDEDSNVDGNWTLLGYAGETSANAAGFLKTGTTHRYMTRVAGDDVTRTDSNPVVVYSVDGPKGFYDPAYLTQSSQVVGTGSLQFGNQITGAAGGQTKLRVWIAGAVPTGAVGSTVSVYTSSTGGGTALLTFSASATPLMQSASFTFNASSKITIVHSSSVNTYNLNTLTPGYLIYISGSAT